MLKNYALLKVLLFTAPDSGGATVQDFATYVEQVQPLLFDRTTYCAQKIVDIQNASPGLSLALVHAMLTSGDPPPPNLDKASHVLQTVREAYQTQLQPPTKRSMGGHHTFRMFASSKIQHLNAHMAYPVSVNDRKQIDAFYIGLHVGRWSHYDNARRLRVFKQVVRLSEMSQPMSRDFWIVSPFTMNTIYRTLTNTITMPWAVLMFNGLFDGELGAKDYGRLGACLGHEIGHALGPAGRSLDASGRIVIWRSHSLGQFDKMEQCLAQQYQNFNDDGYYGRQRSPANINGFTTLEENFADNVGVPAAYQAYLNQYQGVCEQGYNHKQLFFLSYATSLCSLETTQSLVNLRETGYAPHAVRLNGVVSNMDDFADAFNCPKGTPMNPIHKCRMWK